jgi:LysM repeat protein
MRLNEFDPPLTESLAVGDPVIITGDVEFQGKTGDVRELGRDGAFVVVNLYNHGPYSFHASDVEYNDYADAQDEQDSLKEHRMRITELNKRTRIDESLLLEDPVYCSFKQVGRYIAERRMSEKEILQVFADAEAGMTSTATGTNRTMLGRGKDKATDLAASIRDSLGKVLSSIQNSVPVSAVDTAYDQATDALAGLTGGQKGQVMQAIKKYRMLVKKYPKSSGFAKAALVAITGLATGGAGLPVIAGLTYALDAAIKGEKLSSVLGKGAGAAALAWAGQSIAGAMGSDSAAASTAGTDPVSNLVTPDKFPTADLPTYTVQAGDTLSQIAQDNGVSVKELIGLNPQLADATGATGGQSMNPDVIFPGQEITLPPESGSGTYDGGVGTSAGTQADIASGQIPDSEISRRLTGDVGANPSVSPAVDAAPTTSAAPAPASAPTPTGSSNTFTGTMIANEPVVPGQPLSARQVAIVDLARSMGNSYSPEVMQSYNLAKGIKENSQIVTKIRESVQHKILPFEQLIDQKRTEMTWTLNESVGRKNNSFVLTTQGTYAVFENVERYRRAMMEVAGVPGSTRPALYRPDAPGAATPAPAAKKPGLLSRGLSRVGGALSTFGRQFTTNVTKEKLKMNWHQQGKPSDSDQLAAWLVKQGVPQDVVTPIYKKMGLPVAAAKPVAQQLAKRVMSLPMGAAAPTAQPTAPTPTAATAPGQPIVKYGTVTNAQQATGFPGEDPQGAGYVGRREVARRQAARDAAAAKKPSTPNFGQQTAGYKSVNYAPNIKTGVSLPKPAAPAAPAPTVTSAVPKPSRVTAQGGATADERANFEKKLAAAAKLQSAGVAEGEVTRTPTGIVHKATNKYGAGEEPSNRRDSGIYARDMDRIDKQKIKDLDSSMGITWKNRGTLGVEVDEQQAAEQQEKVGNMDADQFDAAMARLKQLAGAGPLKTVYDPAKRVYKNVPTAVQPQTQPKK